MTEPASPDEGARPDRAIDAPFVPVRGRRMATGVAVLALLIFAMVAVVANAWQPGDRMVLFGFGVLIALLMWRYASIRAVVTDHGLRVRNLVLTREVEWDQVEAIRFADGDPWPYLQMGDGDDLAIMAIQRSDGARSRDEAQRLIDLIELRRT